MQSRSLALTRPVAADIDNMMSALPCASFPIVPPATDAGGALIGLVDQVFRLTGRLVEARKMTTQVATLRPPHWLVLTAIVRAATPPSVARIGRSLGHSRQAIRRIAAELEAEGLIAGIDEPNDRRAKVFVPTDRGHGAHGIADREGHDWAARIAAGLSAEALRQASAVLSDIRGRLEDEARALDRSSAGAESEG